MLRSGGGQLLTAAVAVEHAGTVQSEGPCPLRVVFPVPYHQGVFRRCIGTGAKHMGYHVRLCGSALVHGVAAYEVKITGYIEVLQYPVGEFLRL